MSGSKSARTPWLRGSQRGAAVACVSKTPTAEMPTQVRCGSSGCGTIVCRIRPPAPGCQVATRLVVGQRLDVRPGRAPVVAPEQPGRLDAGDVVAVRCRGQAPDGLERCPVLAVGRRRLVAVGEARPAVGPASRRGPRCARPPGRTTASHRRPGSRPLPGSTMRSWIGQPSHNGPRSDQSRRVGVALEDERPLGRADEEEHSGHGRRTSGISRGGLDVGAGWRQAPALNG